MHPDRRTFLLTLAAVPLLGRRSASQAATPQWVPPGFPAFYEDSFGLIVHKNSNSTDGISAPANPKDPRTWGNDPGDTTQREGFSWFGIWLLEQKGAQPPARPTLPWEKALQHLQTEKRGEFRRHPTHPEWKKPENLSRDQQTPIVAALGALGPAQTLGDLWEQFDKRGRICQNNDSGGPDHQNLFMRARKTGTIEAFGEFLLAAMVWSIAARGSGDRDDTGDDLNFVVNLAAASQWRPTKTSDAVICEYVRTRPVNYGCYLERYRDRFRENGLLEGVDRNLMIRRVEELRNEDPTPDCHPIVGALRWYFRAESGAPWGPAAIWEGVVKQYFLPRQCLSI